jgi:hypothetical protein
MDPYRMHSSIVLSPDDGSRSWNMLWHCTTNKLSYAQWNVSEKFGILLWLTARTKLTYSTNTQQDASLKDLKYIWRYNVLSHLMLPWQHENRQHHTILAILCVPNQWAERQTTLYFHLCHTNLQLNNVSVRQKTRLPQSFGKILFGLEYLSYDSVRGWAFALYPEI